MKHHRIIPYMTGGDFSPTQIDGLRLWLKADAGVFTDAAGTAPASVDGAVIGCWKDQSGSGYDVSQNTTSKKPLLKLGSNGIHGRAVIQFDGVDDILARTVAGWLSSDSAGSVFAVFRISAGETEGNLLTTCDQASNTRYVLFCFTTSSFMRLWYAQRNNDTDDFLYGSTALAVDTPTLAAWRSDGAAGTLRVNGADQTLTVASGANQGDWFADSADRDNFALGAYRTTGDGGFFKGGIAEILAYGSNLTGANLADVEGYLNARYGLY